MVFIACKPCMPHGALHMISQCSICAPRGNSFLQQHVSVLEVQVLSIHVRLSASHIMKITGVVRFMPGTKRLVKLASLSDAGGPGYAHGMLNVLPVMLLMKHKAYSYSFMWLAIVYTCNAHPKLPQVQSCARKPYHEAGHVFGLGGECWRTCVFGFPFHD